MTREIKFRCWDNEKKEMYFFKEGYVDTGREFEGNIFMQFTGLLDKNGVEIYEGDLMRDEDEQHIWEVKFGTHETCHGDYYSSIAHGFYLADTAKDAFIPEHSFPYYQDTEVIGNRFENPELLDNK